MNDLPIVQARELYKTYRAGDVDVHALRGVNLDVEKGEFVSIMGASGSGKSTLFNILGALTPPTSGSVQIDGKNLANLSNAARSELRKKTVGFVFQKYNLLPTLSAEDNIRIVQYIGNRATEFSPEFRAQIPGALGDGLQLLAVELAQAGHHPVVHAFAQQQHLHSFGAERFPADCSAPPITAKAGRSCARCGTIPSCCGRTS